jgi:hypothetical protein
LALVAAVAAGCAETAEQHAARLAVERKADKAGRPGKTRCTSNPVRLFFSGPAASVFVCIVRREGVSCDRYIVRRRATRYAVELRLRDGDCILPAD